VVNSPLRKPKKKYDANDTSAGVSAVPSLRFDDDDAMQEDHNHENSFSDDESHSPHHRQEEASLEDEEEEEEEEEEFNPFLFMHGLPPHSTVAIKNKICLPPSVSQHKIALVLDLDETLVHCTIDPIPNPDFVFPVTFNDVCYEVYVRKRPYVDYFLQTVCKDFEVIVFTASQKVYANKLLDRLDPDLNMVGARLFREACLGVFGNYIKDLSVLNRDLAHVSEGQRGGGREGGMYTPVDGVLDNAYAQCLFILFCIHSPPPSLSLSLGCRLCWWTTLPMPTGTRWTTASPSRAGSTTTTTQVRVG
jgi:hypothetical protein